MFELVLKKPISDDGHISRESKSTTVKIDFPEVEAMLNEGWQVVGANAVDTGTCEAEAIWKNAEDWDGVLYRLYKVFGKMLEDEVIKGNIKDDQIDAFLQWGSERGNEK